LDGESFVVADGISTYGPFTGESDLEKWSDFKTWAEAAIEDGTSADFFIQGAAIEVGAVNWTITADNASRFADFTLGDFYLKVKAVLPSGYTFEETVPQNYVIQIEVKPR
jgi:hypothetical protein